MHVHPLPGQDTRIHTAHHGHVQEAVDDGGDHQADGIHVGGNHDGRAQLRAGAAAQPVHRAEPAAAEFVDERFPARLDQPGSRVFIPGETGQ